MAGEDDDLESGVDPNDSTNGEGADGPQTGNEGDEDVDLSSEHPDDQADDGESEDEQVDAQPERPSRGATRFQRLANETREAKDRAERAEREIQELRRSQAQQQTQLTEQQERERLALMTPEERAEYRITKFEREAFAREQQREFRTQNAIDKAAYDAKATLNPVYKKYQEEVEARFQSEMKAGRPVEREVILKFLLGERALNGASTSTRKARTNGQRRVAAQRVSGGSGRSDTASQRGKAGDTPESRLKDVFI